MAVNITEWQLIAGWDRLREATVADTAVDGIISVEAAFHFRSRKASSKSVTECCGQAVC